jgi:DNA repair exonuclease SbcCD ATPase subunit
MGLRCSKAKAKLESIEESERELEESEAALAQAKAENSELRAELEEREAALALAYERIREYEAQRSKAFWWTPLSSEEATCPVCDKTFSQGGFHPASQKLWQHMGHGKMHRKARQKLSWDSSDWLPVVW